MCDHDCSQWKKWHSKGHKPPKLYMIQISVLLSGMESELQDIMLKDYLKFERT